MHHSFDNASGMKVEFLGKVPKEAKYPESNEDAFSFANEKAIIAVSDGASESFDSKTWANLLVERCVNRPEINENWIAEAAAEYSVSFDPENLSWSKQSAFARGSFATLLGMSYADSDREVEVVGIGDSIAVLLDGESRIDSFPYTSAAEFHLRPELLCTNTLLNGFVQTTGLLPQHVKKWSIIGLSRPIILCMTDALGEWAIRNEEEGNPKWAQLSNIYELVDFEELVLGERQERRMRVDDATLVRVSFEVSEHELPKS